VYSYTLIHAASLERPTLGGNYEQILRCGILLLCIGVPAFAQTSSISGTFPIHPTP
jgi:hypothetical protein